MTSGGRIRVPSQHRHGFDARCGDVDELALMLAARGERVRLNADERRAIVWRLTDRKLSANEIARLTGLCDRSVTRLRAARKRPA